MGDWEADTVEGVGKTAYIAAFVDKPAKLLRGKVMPDKATLNKAAIRTFRSIPDEYIKTAGNGKEFSGHKGLAQSLGCEIYFAHSYHSW
jgi:IS30 family transposase